MSKFSRRRFLSTSAAATSALALGAYVNVSPARESKSPNGKLNIAGIGVTGRGGEDIAGVASENIIALADVDENKLNEGMKRFNAERKYKDFRVMLEKEEKNLDAVVVGTPDHTHAPAAAMALRLGKHVYCEKPLTHTVKEARVLATLAKEKKLVTQMGNQIHAGDNYRRVVELVQSGAIGKVTEVHVWAGAQYHSAKFTTGTTAPKGLDWDLWLGPAPERPYSEGVHPFNWRKFWDYGTGTLGDFGCHYMDLAHWALNLRAPTAVEATGHPTPYDPVSAPRYCIAHYEHPARGDMPACKLHWYDSGKQPELWGSIANEDAKKATAGGGQLFVGSGGMLLSNYGGRWLLPDDKFKGFQAPKQSIPASIGHHQEWINAIKTGGTTTCNFDYAGALTEAVLLGTVAYRSGKRVEWDAANLKVTNNPDAQQFVHTEYRKGWTL
jgi:predicted dehydrogenase